MAASANPDLVNGQMGDDQNAYYAREHERFMTAFHFAMEQYAQGTFEHKISEKVIDEYRDIVTEINAMAARCQVVEQNRSLERQAQAVAIEALSEALLELSMQNLDFRIERELSEEFQPLKEHFNGSVESLCNILNSVAASTGTVKHATNEIAQASDDLSRRTEQQAASLEETVAALAEITSTVARTATSAKRARVLVSAAKVSAEHSSKVVHETVVAINKIEVSSRQIGQIIAVMNEIAFQTNLLALNAGVEAARAGEAGRGFAVIASEVRALAQRSGEAAKEIRGHIQVSTAQVGQGVDLVARTGKALEDIAAKVAEINSVVTEIAASAEEQATGLQEVNTAISQMDQVTQQNAAMAEEATAACRALSEETDGLAALIGEITISRSNSGVVNRVTRKPQSAQMRHRRVG